MGTHAPSPAPGWWRRAVVYQVYIRSFADADGDGIGDVAGIRSRIPYLRDLGVDAIWVTPWYPSPMRDGGYDVADYRGIDPRLGSLADADALIAEAHAAGLRVLIDLVPNHTSADHPWFREAVASPPGSPARDRYLFRDGRGEDGAAAPNDWGSVFGGPAWTRLTGPDGRPEQWYLHLFDPSQPDLDWSHPDVRAEFESILRFWFDRGVDGFRIDVASGLAKADGLPDLAAAARAGGGGIPDEQPHFDRPEVHDIYRRWREIARSYDPERVLLGEVHVSSPERLARYLRPDELHGAFNFHFMRGAFEASVLHDAIDETMLSHASVGAAPAWVFSNHDEPRHASRFGRPMTAITTRDVDESLPVDLPLGTRRARAATLLLLALPGAVYLYQGEELGLPEVMDLPAGLREDPIFFRTGGTILGRDGCRIPLPWSGTAPPFGFGPAGTVPWLPQPEDWAALTAEAQAADPGSMLSLYRAALRLRREHAGFDGEYFRWVPSPERTLHFEREAFLRCALNLSEDPMPLPTRRRPLLSSVDFEGDELPPGAAAWYVAAAG
ncbi:MAG: hypothetical protein RL338_48 [Chloroflexota bacterium]